MFELTPYYRKRRNGLNVYDPFRDFDDIERSFFGERVHSFSTDVLDNGDSYSVETDLPGFKKEDIHIDIAEALELRGQGQEGQLRESREKLRFILKGL